MASVADKNIPMVKTCYKITNTQKIFKCLECGKNGHNLLNTKEKLIYSADAVTKHRHVKTCMSYFECFSVTLMLRCNLTKSDESTSFILNVD